MKLPLLPRPVPAGMSAIDESSSDAGDKSTRRSASRMIGCSISSTELTRSSLEYLMMPSATNVWWRVMYTYLSMAAATRKPVCSPVVAGQVRASAAKRNAEG